MTPVARLSMVVATLAYGATTAGCCNRGGCDATSRLYPEPSIEQGIAGYAMSASDVVGICSECPLIDATLLVWKDTGVDGADGVAEVIAERAPQSVEISRQVGYELELDATQVLLCTEDFKTCAPLEIRDSEVRTVHYLGVGDDTLRVLDEDGGDVDLRKFECDPGDCECAACGDCEEATCTPR